METASDTVSDPIPLLSMQRLRARRLTGSTVLEESDVADLLLDKDVFPSAEVEVSFRKSLKYL